MARDNHVSAGVRVFGVRRSAWLGAGDCQPRCQLSKTIIIIIMESISQLVSRLPTCSSKAKSVVLTELYSRLNLHLVRANAIAILARSIGKSDVARVDIVSILCTLCVV